MNENHANGSTCSRRNDQEFKRQPGRRSGKNASLGLNAHGEMVKACVVREANQFMHRIVEETADAG